jgi:hypothetical protein
MKNVGIRSAGARVGFPGLVLGLSLFVGPRSLSAQPVSGQNVNVTGGPAFLTLDPFEIVGNPWRNQEVEAYCAVDTRSPSVVVCSAVDYRLVDLPGGADGEHNDSWNMFGQSVDGGVTWVSRLVPGYPLDPMPNILSGYDFAADPIVQAGAAGLFYHAGLVANRKAPKNGNGPPNAPGAIYVSTWINLNDREDDLEPVKLVENGITLPATGNSGQFRDRPHLAVGEPNGKTCTHQVRRDDDTVVDQTIPATPAYLAFTTFVGGGNKVKTQIHFMRSEDCGRSWSSMNKITDATASINVGVQVVPFPGSGRILLFWRRGAQGKETDALMVARSDDGGKKFGKAQVFAEICPFDQDTSPTTFRVTTVPAAVADASRAYVFWPDRRDPATGTCAYADGTLHDARILVATTTDGVTKSGPFMLDAHAGRGHQIFPAASTAAGRVHAAWLDFRNDASGVFQEFIDERPIVQNDPTVLPPGIRQRHTADLYAAEADAGSNPAFGPSEQVSQYIHGKPEGSDDLEQLQWNVVNSRNFDHMNVAFFGDYNAVTTESLVPRDPVGQPGVWATNGSPGSPPTTPVFHRFWTDGRNLSLLSDENYAFPRPYTPPDLNTALVEETLPPESLYDPTRMRPLCEPEATGTKNLDIYTSRSTHGFHAFAPWNNKTMLTPDGDSVQRAFVVVVQNTVPAPLEPPAVTTRFRLTIANQPLGNPGGVPERASFEQFSFDTATGTTIPPAPVVEEELTIPAGSAIARTVYVTSSDPRAAVRVDVEKLDAAGAVVGTRAIFLNPDPTAPPNLQRPGNVDPTAPEFDIQRFEVHGLEISDSATPQDIGLTGGVPHQGSEDDSVDWGTPRWQNPRWQNPRWQNPRWQNPRWQNPRWQNPRWQNPRWQNYAVSADDAELGSRHIRTEYTNTGNTTSAYDARVIVNSLTTEHAFQLVVYKLYTATPMEGCDAAQVGYTQVLVNIPDYDASLANLSQPDASREATFSLQPGETAFVELIVHPTAANPDVTTFDPAATPPIFIGTPQAVDTADVVPGQPVPEPEPEFSQLFIVAATLPGGTVGLAYPPTILQALGGQPPLTWTVVDPQNFPPGLSLDGASGGISGIPTGAGAFDFTVQVTDGLQIALQTFHIDIAPPPPMTFVVANTADAGAGSLRQAILDANANPALDTIEFNISGPAPHTIALQSALPAITDPAVIDGTTQPGFAVGSPVIELDGTGAGAAAHGLHITGGGSTVSGLVINRFSGNGILLESGGGNVIRSSFVGTDLSGAQDFGNAGNGVQMIDSGGNTIGGPVVSLRNVVSGNSGEGVRIDGASATGNVVRGNHIGTDGSGSADLGNGASGVYIRRAPGNSVIGNVISGNDGFAGVAICGDPTFCGGFDAGTPGSNASGNAVQRNFIGIDATGALELGNNGYGVSIDGAPNTVVGGNAVDRNVISDNGLHGIQVFGNAPDGNQIIANHIGTDAAGTADLGNGGDGVNIAAGIGNRITANNIRANGALGIDLGPDGVTPNDTLDADEGANDLQNFPVLNFAVRNGTNLEIDATFHSTPNTAFDVEWFSSADCDPSGNGEGRTPLGTSTFFTNAGGDAFLAPVFVINVPPPGEFITATATGQSSGSTSEFSACEVVGVIIP